MPLSATNLLALKSVVQQRIFTARYASMHKRWMRPYLKDLFHRRVIAGPDPVMARATLDNWNYPAEISAFSHRLQIPEVDPDLIVQALTNQTFFERKDVEERASLAQPSKEQDTAQLQRCPSNEDLVGKGASLVRHILLTYLRSHWPKAPEEFIVAVAQRLASNTALTETAEHLGIQHICRTAEFPPSERTLHTALFSLINIMHQQQQQKTMEAENAKERGEDGVRKVRQFVCTFFLPRLQQLPLEDVLPFRHPLPIFKQYMYKWEKVDDIEPRVIASGGLSTAMPFYQVAIYADRDRIIGESAGEELWVALDLAAQNALLSLWRVTDEPRVFPYKLEEVYASRFERAQRQNHSIGDICAEDTDLSLYTSEELAQDPLDPSEMAQHYFTRVKPQLGLPHRKRLRHTFSRGSIGRFTRRFMVKPEPHNI